ncbi:uncharacterized protein LOC111613549 isoform X2 [Centruroides sculpturatus]|uniref:uncharacterized protein LOC111613549 isoform X2 n=1 Tax=Centruroides sculpturatus TaxID=218467 RepID=UPI000C6E50F5|nr:uncharacterized protein LOC111613549 isoform X2 [Centruroides sculpturatus]
MLQTLVESVYGSSDKESGALDQILDRDELETFESNKNRLKKLYQTEYSYMRSLLWKYKRRDFPLKHYYVNLKLQETDNFGVSSIGDILDIRDIFREVDDGHTNILVCGDPGYGKTTLCKKIAYDWAVDDPSNNYLSRFDIVAVLTLTELESNKKLEDAVLEDVFETSEPEIKKKLRRANLNVLIILDEYDDVNRFDRTKNFLRKGSFGIFRKLTIIVTSRPHFAERIREYMNFRFDLQEFSPEQKEEYAKLVFKQDVNKTQTLIEVLQSEFYFSLAKIPLFLHLFCCFHSNSTLGDIRRYKTNMYIHIMQLITNRSKRKLQSNVNMPLGNYFALEEILVRLGKLIYEKNTSEKVLFYPFDKNLKITIDELNECVGDRNKTFCKGLDFLSHGFDNQNKFLFDCVHESIKEYLVALYLYKNPEVPFLNITSDSTVPCITEFTTHHNFITFYFGLFKNEKIPKSCLNNLEKGVFSLDISIRIYNEIVSEEDKEIFSNTVKIYENFCNSFINYPVWSIPPDFSQIYIIVDIYESTNVTIEKLNKLHKRVHLSCQVEIFIFLKIGKKFLQLNDVRAMKNDWKKLENIRNILSKSTWNKFNIYLCGIFQAPFFIGCEIEEKNRLIIYPAYLFKAFSCVEKPAQKLFDDSNQLSYELVRLKFTTEDDNEHNCLLLKKDLFESIEPYIKLFPNL